jgi:hypothetical protein
MSTAAIVAEAKAAASRGSSVCCGTSTAWTTALVVSAPIVSSRAPMPIRPTLRASSVRFSWPDTVDIEGTSSPAGDRIVTVPTMAEGKELLIVGGGLSSARAIKAYREAGGDAPVRLLSSDSYVPYHRPPLSKKYLRGEAEVADTLVESEAFYAGHGVEVELELVVSTLDLEGRRVLLEGGGERSFDKLLIASGATPRRLDVPGADLEGRPRVAHASATRRRFAMRRAARATRSWSARGSSAWRSLHR